MMRTLDMIAVALIATMMLGPLAMAPAYGPYVAPGTASDFTESTTPYEADATGDVEEGGVSPGEVAGADEGERDDSQREAAQRSPNPQNEGASLGDTAN